MVRLAELIDIINRVIEDSAFDQVYDEALCRVGLTGGQESEARIPRRSAHATPAFSAAF